MAYDEELADRIRALLSVDDRAAQITEKRMFGGLAFLVHGNMAVVASGQGGLMVRVPPADSSKLLARSKAEPMVIRGKPMTGWLRVPGDAVRRKPQLSRWVGIGTDFAASLPPKR